MIEINFAATGWSEGRKIKSRDSAKCQPTCHLFWMEIHKIEPYETYKKSTNLLV
jgi:hypothetical protein